MKEEYGNGMVLESTGMIDYIRQSAKKRFETRQTPTGIMGLISLGGSHMNFQPKYAFEEDIDQALLDDFYELSERKVVKEKIFMVYQNTHTDYLFLSDTSFYLYHSSSKEISKYSYKGLEIRNAISGFVTLDTYSVWLNDNYCEELSLFLDTNKELARFLLDLRDFVKRR